MCIGKDGKVGGQKADEKTEPGISAGFLKKKSRRDHARPPSASWMHSSNSGTSHMCLTPEDVVTIALHNARPHNMKLKHPIIPMRILRIAHVYDDEFKESLKTHPWVRPRDDNTGNTGERLARRAIHLASKYDERFYLGNDLSLLATVSSRICGQHLDVTSTAVLQATHCADPPRDRRLRASNDHVLGLEGVRS